MVAYVKSNLVFSIANLFSMPISHDIPGIQLVVYKVTESLPNGKAGEGARVSFRIGILALGSGFTTKFVS
jgi:hypothetical protein